MPLKSHLSYMW